MKFAFIENRYKTFFWDAIAREVVEAGHQVIWLVQNHFFCPHTGTKFLIPYPPATLPNSALMPVEFDIVRHSDRHINYFGGNDRHYPYYWGEIERVLNRERPDVIVGESTLFHELMAVVWCRREGVPFLHPSMPGYPGGRYSIYFGDTKEPLGTNPEVPDDSACLEMAEAIRKREKIPDYMIPPSLGDVGRKYPMPRSMRDRLNIIRGYIAGERYNTPSPWIKWRLDRAIVGRLKEWEGVVVQKSLPSAESKAVLYPLQMQPESNLDLWGQKFRDQAALVKKLADALPANWHLIVKANPKAKYEVSKELLKVLKSHPKVFPISLSKSMAEVLPTVELVCTVTGTIAVEAVLSRKPLVQFGPGVVEDGIGCSLLNEPERLNGIIDRIGRGDFALASDKQRIDLVKRLYATTFPGKVSDPVNQPAAMESSNVREVARRIMKFAENGIGFV